MRLDAMQGKGTQNLYRHANGNIYFKMYREGRGELCKSTRTQSLEDAKIVADKYRVQFLGPEASLVNRGRKFCGELFPDFIKRKSLTLRPGTIETMNTSYKHLEPYLKTMLPEEVTAQWWESTYVPEKRKGVRIITKRGVDREVSQANRKFFNDRKILLEFLLQLKSDGVLKAVPKLVKVDPPTAVGRVYSDEEIAGLLHWAGDTDLRTQILMAITMGMRIGEVMKMDWARIDMKARTMHLRACDTKTNRPRTFGISDRVYQRLASVKPTGPLFAAPNGSGVSQGRSGNRRAWTTCKRLAGVSGRFHWLRHTFLTKAFKQSTNPALICEYAGLSLQEAQDTYLHFTPEDTRVVSTLVEF